MEIDPNHTPFRRTPISTPFDLRFLLAFFSVSIRQALHNQFTRVGPSLSALLPSQPRIVISPIISPFRPTPAAPLGTLSPARLSRCLVRQALHHQHRFGSSLSALFLSHSRIVINPHLSPFSSDSHQQCLRPLGHSGLPGAMSFRLCSTDIRTFDHSFSAILP